MSSYDEARYAVPTRSFKDKDSIVVVDKNGRELSRNEIEKLVREYIEEAMKREIEKQKQPF